MVKIAFCSLVQVLGALLAVGTARCVEQVCPICRDGSKLFNRGKVLNELLAGKNLEKLQRDHGVTQITCGVLEKTVGTDCDVEMYAYACECRGIDNSCGQLADLCEDESLFNEDAIIYETTTCRDLDMIIDFTSRACTNFRKNLQGLVKNQCCGGKKLRQTLPDIETIDCSICSGNETTELDGVLLGVEGLTCSDVETIGSFSEDVCEGLRDNFDWVCGCPGVEKPPCTACPNGEPVSVPDAPLIEIDDETIICADAEELASIRCFEDDFDNQALHDLVVEKCGCGGPPTGSPDKAKLSDGAVVGIVIAAAFVGFGCFGAAYLWSRKQIST